MVAMVSYLAYNCLDKHIIFGTEYSNRHAEITVCPRVVKGLEMMVHSRVIWAHICMPCLQCVSNFEQAAKGGTIYNIHGYWSIAVWNEFGEQLYSQTNHEYTYTRFVRDNVI